MLQKPRFAYQVNGSGGGTSIATTVTTTPTTSILHTICSSNWILILSLFLNIFFITTNLVGTQLTTSTLCVIDSPSNRLTSARSAFLARSMPSLADSTSPVQARSSSVPALSQRLFDADIEVAVASINDDHNNADIDGSRKEWNDARSAAAAAAAGEPCPVAPAPPVNNMVDEASGAHVWYTPPSIALNVPDDLSESAEFNLASHEITWNYCTDQTADYMSNRTLTYCSDRPTSEQSYQLSWFGLHVLAGSKRRPFPKYQPCIQLPPRGYSWPTKHTELPARADAVKWPNLLVQNREDLIVFNKDTPKNLYHFDAVQYDRDAKGEIDFAAKYIPFGPKVRLMLDVGAGGGSLGILLKRKYDVQVLSTVFADWPYCEYISERGGLCMLVDVMEPMPFAKFTFDVIHVSWVYHGQEPTELYDMLSELNRVLRPGGYLWMRGGWSNRQVTMMKDLLIAKLGYSSLMDHVTAKKLKTPIVFGPNLFYDVDWDAVLVKPIRAKLVDSCAASSTTTAIASAEGRE